MPPGGRPSAGLEAVRRRDYMEWQAQSRFEELDDEDDGYSPVPPRPTRIRGDKLRFTGHDLGAGQFHYDDDLAYGDDFDPDEDDDEGPVYEEDLRFQAAMRAKEEALVERALRRMNRARIRGDGEIALSREEIDALERRQLIPRPDKQTRSQASVAPTKAIAAKGKKKSAGGGGGLLGFGNAAASKAKAAKSANRMTSLPDMSQNPSPPQTSPGYSSRGGTPPPGPMVPVPVGYLQQPLSGRPSLSPEKRRNVRASSRPNTRQSAMPDPRDFRPSSSSSRLLSETETTSRSRSSSAAQSHGNPYASLSYPYPQAGPARRHAVSYPAGYRSPPHTTAGARLPSGSGLGQEIIVISSDEEDEDEDESDEDESESDEGVTLDVVPESSSSGYAIMPRGAGQTRRPRR